MKFLLFLVSTISILGADPFRELGTITATNAIAWVEQETNIVSNKIYVSPVNLPTPVFELIATVTTNRWYGDSTKTLNGQKILYITSINDKNIESEEMSEKVLVTFKAGVPLPPTKIQIYTLIQLAATNSLPPSP